MDLGAIAISGSGGLIGSALIRILVEARIIRLVRTGGHDADSVLWDPVQGSIDTERLEGCSAVVHLAGEPIAAGRWSPEIKERIRASRVEGTRILADGLTRLKRPPRVLISASAIGYYGERGEEELTEDSAPGDGFLAQVGREWEKAASRAAQAGIRVVHLRTGLVLARQGGAFPRLMLPFKLGIGGRLGTGRQWMSWIHIYDLVRIIRFLLINEDVHGAVNAVSPTPVRNSEFSRALGRALHRPALMPLPASVMRLMVGEMADSLLLCSQRVIPRRLMDLRFPFKFPTLAEAFADLVKG
ncbi:MAG: TIGR01777 family oxidoreductase [Acidobacteriota bacterium]